MKNDQIGKLPLLEKIGYGFSDASANFVFQIMVMFQVGFYTDVFGITAAAAGTLLLVGRFWDAIFDPIMGSLADRTNTRWGKFRPWLLWTAVPFALMFFLTFYTPNFSPSGKLVYAYLTYILLMTVYSMNNTPYSALNGVMTGDVNERTSLSSWRFIFAQSATILVQGFLLLMVASLGRGNAQAGWARSIGLLSVLCIVFFIITFLSVKERIKPNPEQKASLKEDISGLAKNGPWLAMFGLTLFVFITLALWGSAMYYYFNYFISKAHLFTFLQWLGMAATPAADGSLVLSGGQKILDAMGLLAKPDLSNTAIIGFSLFNMIGTILSLIGIVLSKRLTIRFSKKSVFMTGLLLTVLFTALFFVLSPTAIGATFVLNILKSLAYSFTIPLLWAMMADVADYSEWKTARRSTGFIFAGIVFALKAGLGFGGAICGWLLSLYGYVPNAAQNSHALFGIKMTASIYPAITFAIGAVALSFYSISKKLSLQIQDELVERRKSYQY
ncbi:MAG TPA: MFS transporter [bacterium]|nr:MFS transporter [bacterium]HQI47047.1 MFS transporter [bacterium]HQJ65907.1 MFS transporter [bacterium]